MAEDRRGVLYPARLPEFHRLPPPPSLDHAVRWFWIPEWALAPGEELRQEILPFPACNVVVEPDGVTVVGPPTRRSERVLQNSGWAVGALLRPAAAPALVPSLAALRDAAAPLEEPALLGEVAGAMADPHLSSAARRDRAATALAEWIEARAPEPGADGLLANELADALADAAITRVDQLAPRLHASTRTLQRIAERFFGLSLRSMIRRRRVQEAAERLREDATVTVAAVAGEVGYADQAHFATDFKAVVGVTPSEYRAGATAEAETDRA